MTMGRRYLLMLPAAWFAGWLAGRWLVPVGTMLPPAAEPPGAAAPAKPMLAEWQRWLNQTVVLAPPADLETIWAAVPASMDGLSIQHQLWLDEILFGLPWPSVVEFLTDERFCDLSRQYDPDHDSSWRRRVLEAGVDEAMKLSGRLPTLALNGHLDALLRKRLVRDAPEKGLAWTKQRDGRPHVTAQFLMDVAQHNLEDAKAIWSATEEGEERDFYAGVIVEALADVGWEVGAAWARESLPEEKREKHLRAMFFLMDPAKKKQLFESASEVADPMLRSLLYSQSLPGRANDAEDLIGQALALPGNSLDAGGWKTMGRESVWYDTKKPDQNAAGVAENVRRLAERVPLEHRRSYLEGAALMGAYNNFPVATHLLEFLEKPMIAEMSQRWAQQDPTAASGWLTTLEPSPQRDAAVVAFCRETATVDPAMAAQWALSVGDPSLQARAVQDALGAWRQLDPAAADAWADGHVEPKAGR